MKSTLKNIAALTIPALLILFIILELFFRFIIPAAERPKAYFDKEHQIFRLDNKAEITGVHTIGKAAQQRARWRINNFGWNSSIDYYPNSSKKLVAVLGDSFVEGFQVDVEKRFSEILRDQISANHEVYSFGISGAPLSEYLNQSRYVDNIFDPDILVISIVYNDFVESLVDANQSDTQFLLLEAQKDSIIERKPSANERAVQFNWRKQVLRKSALIRYLVFNLSLVDHFRKLFNEDETEVEFTANVNVNSLLKYEDEIKEAAEYTLKSIRQENPERRVILLLDAPRESIYSGEEPHEAITQTRDLMKVLSSKYEFEFIDLYEVMLKDYERVNMKFNSKIDGHWNQYGHQVVAKTLYQQIRVHY